MPVRILVGLQELLLTEHIEIHEGAAPVAVGADEGLHLLDALGLPGQTRVELHLQGHGVAPVALDREDGHGLGRGGAGMATEAGIRVGAVGDGLAGVAAVGGGAHGLTQANGVGPGEQAGDEVEAARGGGLLDQITEQVGELDGVLVGPGVAAAETRHRLQHEADGLGVGVVVVEDLEQLLPGEAPLLVHALLQGGEGVSHRGQGGTVDAHVVVIDAPVADVATAVDGVAHEQIEGELGLHAVHEPQVDVEPLADAVEGQAHVLLVEAQQRRRAVLDGVVGDHVAEGHVEDGGEVELHHIVEGVLLTGDGGPVAARGDPLAGELSGVPVAHEALGHALLAHEARRAVAVLEQVLDRLVEELLVEALPDAHGDVGGDLHAVQGLEDEEGDAVGAVLPVRSGPADLVVLGVDEEHADQVEDGLLVFQHTGGHIALIEGVEELVELADAAGAVELAREDGDPGDELAGLLKGPGWLGNEALIHVGHVEEVGAEGFVLLLRGHLAGPVHALAHVGLHTQ